MVKKFVKMKFLKFTMVKFLMGNGKLIVENAWVDEGVAMVKG